MGVKGYHFYLNKFGCYSEVDLREFLKEQPVDIIVIDFCAFYTRKLKEARYSSAFLWQKIVENGMFVILEFRF